MVRSGGRMTPEASAITRLLVVIAALGALLGLQIHAPRAGAQSASDGTRTLTASQVANLNPAGAIVTVSGSGYDVERGIYLAFCVVPPAGAMPSPCGGGADATGTSGASKWISSNPPANGEGLAIPYGPGGTFTESIVVSAMISPAVDCRLVACAIVTRSDHTRLNDRSQDVILPVTFQGAPSPTPLPPTPTRRPADNATPSPSLSPTLSPTPVTPTAIPTAPVATLSSDGRRATAGTLSLEVSTVSGLDPNGAEVVINGTGYVETKGVYVALCATQADGVGTCAAGSKDVSAWVSSNPPDYARELATPYGPGGSFELRLLLKPVIDANTDCRVAACAVVSRADDTAPGDRSQELAISVSFAAQTASPIADASPAATPTPATDPPVDDGGDGSGNALLWLGLVAAGVLATAGAFVAVRKRRGAGGVVSMLLAVLLMSACSNQGANSNAGPTATIPGRDDIVVATATPSPHLPVTVTSADGREVTVSDVSRIVPLWGNLSEVVFGLGLGDNIVARDSTATFAEAANLPIVTRAHDVSAESVLSLRPTVVLASADNSGPKSALDQIRNVGIPVVVFEDPESIDDVIPRIRAIAAALGVAAAGEVLVGQTERALAEVQADIPASGDPLRVAFLYMRGNAGVYLLGGPRSGADSMIRAAGAIDAGTAMGLDNPFTPISSEALAEAAPDAILMTSSGLDSVGGIEGLVRIPGIAQTPAGKERRVITIEDALLYSFGPRTPVALAELIERLYAGASVVP